MKKITKYTIKVTFSLRALYNPDETVLIKQLENNGIMAHIWIQRQYIKRTLQEKLKKTQLDLLDTGNDTLCTNVKHITQHMYLFKQTLAKDHKFRHNYIDGNQGDWKLRRQK